MRKWAVVHPVHPLCFTVNVEVGELVRRSLLVSPKHLKIGIIHKKINHNNNTGHTYSSNVDLVFYEFPTGAKICEATVNIRKGCLANDATGFFFVCIGGLQLARARSHSLHWTVCIPKCAQVRSHVTNLKADQSGRGNGGAIVLCSMPLPSSR